MLPTMGARRRARLASGGRQLLSVLLLMATCGLARAAQPEVELLLRTLNLAAYPAGTAPPQFGGQTLGGGQLTLAELRGKVVLVNYWASWCVECRPEMPVLEGLHREMASQGLAVVGINTRESTETVRRYAEELGLTFQLVLDPDGRITNLYGVIGLPTTFVFGRDGRAVALAIGPREWGSATGRALLRALLSAPAPHLEAR